MTVKAILFDVDGTLVDSNDLQAAAWVEAFAEFDIVIPHKDVHDQIGKGGDNLMPALLDKKVVDEHGEAISNSRARIFKKRHASKVEPFADVAALFRRARADGWKIVLATSGEIDEVEPHIDRLGVRPLLDVVTTASDAEHSKPDPDIFAAALKKVGAEAADAIVVGDSPYDIQAAKKIGLRTIAVRSGGFDDQVLTEAGAVAIYDNPADLLARYDTSPLASH
jgi:HAD superfamily hydrolase (TIGR01509 family)